MLSQTGLEFARAHAPNLGGEDLSRPVVDAKTQHWIRRERTRSLADDAHDRLIREGAESVTRQQAEAFFRLDAYVTGEARQTKFSEL